MRGWSRAQLVPRPGAGAFLSGDADPVRCPNDSTEGEKIKPKSHGYRGVNCGGGGAPTDTHEPGRTGRERKDRSGSEIGRERREGVCEGEAWAGEGTQHNWHGHRKETAQQTHAFALVVGADFLHHHHHQQHDPWTQPPKRESARTRAQVAHRSHAAGPTRGSLCRWPGGGLGHRTLRTNFLKKPKMLMLQYRRCKQWEKFGHFKTFRSGTKFNADLNACFPGVFSSGGVSVRRGVGGHKGTNSAQGQVLIVIFGTCYNKRALVSVCLLAPEAGDHVQGVGEASEERPNGRHTKPHLASIFSHPPHRNGRSNVAPSEPMAPSDVARGLRGLPPSVPNRSPSYYQDDTVNTCMEAWAQEPASPRVTYVSPKVGVPRGTTLITWGLHAHQSSCDVHFITRSPGHQKANKLGGRKTHREKKIHKVKMGIPSARARFVAPLLSHKQPWGFVVPRVKLMRGQEHETCESAHAYHPLSAEPSTDFEPFAVRLRNPSHDIGSRCGHMSGPRHAVHDGAEPCPKGGVQRPGSTWARQGALVALWRPCTLHLPYSWTWNYCVVPNETYLDTANCNDDGSGCEDLWRRLMGAADPPNIVSCAQENAMSVSSRETFDSSQLKPVANLDAEWRISHSLVAAKEHKARAEMRRAHTGNDCNGRGARNQRNFMVRTGRPDSGRICPAGFGWHARWMPF
ncbi:hypothetical protein BC826DRAFT_967128 [Russula brevipes]|nr:hypothetical protein BC826DRAFT_967128 [Russula brevipes]